MIESSNILLIMRHAESSQLEACAGDRERTLTAAGKVQPGIIARKLKELHVSIDQALVSEATRTMETFELLMKNMNHETNAQLYPELYNATLDDILATLSKHMRKMGTVLVLAHCPGVNELTEYLTGHHHFFAPADLAVISAKDEDLVKSLRTPRRFGLMQILKTSS